MSTSSLLPTLGSSMVTDSGAPIRCPDLVIGNKMEPVPCASSHRFCATAEESSKVRKKQWARAMSLCRNWFCFLNWHTVLWQVKQARAWKAHVPVVYSWPMLQTASMHLAECVPPSNHTRVKVRWVIRVSRSRPRRLRAITRS